MAFVSFNIPYLYYMRIEDRRIKLKTKNLNGLI